MFLLSTTDCHPLALRFGYFSIHFLPQNEPTNHNIRLLTFCLPRGLMLQSGWRKTGFLLRRDLPQSSRGWACSDIFPLINCPRIRGRGCKHIEGELRKLHCPVVAMQGTGEAQLWLYEVTATTCQTDLLLLLYLWPTTYSFSMVTAGRRCWCINSIWGTNIGRT